MTYSPNLQIKSNLDFLSTICSMQEAPNTIHLCIEEYYVLLNANRSLKAIKICTCPFDVYFCILLSEYAHEWELLFDLYDSSIKNPLRCRKLKGSYSYLNSFCNSVRWPINVQYFYSISLNIQSFIIKVKTLHIGASDTSLNMDRTKILIHYAQ